MPKFRQQRQIISAKPANKPYELSDEMTCGLRVRIMPSGAKRFFYVFQREHENGRRLVRMPIGMFDSTGGGWNLQEARARAQEWEKQRKDLNSLDPDELVAEARAERERQEVVEESEKYTVEKLVEDWLKARESDWRPQTYNEAKREMERYVLPAIGDIPAHHVNKDHIGAILRPFTSAKKYRMRNLLLGHVSGMYKWAANSERGEADHLHGLPSPSASFSAESVTASRDQKPLSLDSARTLWAALEEHAGDVAIDAIRLMMLCGTRVGETCSAEWKHVDLDAGRWRIPPANTKKNRLHNVELSTAACALLEARRAKGRWVFSAKTEFGHVRRDTANKALKKVIQDFDLKLVSTQHEILDDSVSTHALRKTFATFAAGTLRVSEGVRDHLLNHKPRDELARIYVKVDWSDDARAAWEAWGQVLSGPRDNRA